MRLASVLTSGFIYLDWCVLNREEGGEGAAGEREGRGGA